MARFFPGMPVLKRPQRKIPPMTFTLHMNDLPDGLTWGASVAVDAEMMGLNPLRDRLCLMQFSAGDGTAHLVKFDGKDYSAPNVKKLLTDKKVTKIFHYARADMASVAHYLGVVVTPVYCTKIVSKLVRTFTQYHGLRNVCKDLLGIDVDKQQQTTDWGVETLSPEQLAYAASDVMHLHKIKDILDSMLAREGRTHLAQACFDFLPARAALDNAGWSEEDIFAH